MLVKKAKHRAMKIKLPEKARIGTVRFLTFEYRMYPAAIKRTKAARALAISFTIGRVPPSAVFPVAVRGGVVCGVIGGVVIGEL
jgi:hypothetical protein